MNTAEKKIITANCLRAAAIAFGTYLVAKWTVSFEDPVQNFLIQTVLQLCAHLLIFFFALKLTSKISTTYITAASILFNVVAYAAFFVLALAGKIVQANVVYGILNGISAGMYWSSYNNTMAYNIADSGRRRFLSVNGMGTLAFSIAAPLVMAVIIFLCKSTVNIPEEIYYIFFAVLSVLLIVSAVIFFTVRFAAYQAKMRLRGMFFCKRDKLWNYNLLYSFFTGVVCGVQGAVAIVFVMIFSPYSQVFYMLALSFSTAAASVANIVFGRLRIKNEILYAVMSFAEAAVYIAIGCIYQMYVPMMICILLLAVKNITEALRLPLEILFHTQITSYYRAAESNISGRYYAREVAINAGKILSMAIILIIGLLLPDGEQIRLIVSAFIGMVLCNIIMMIFYHKTEKEYHRMMRRRAAQSAVAADLPDSEPANHCA